MKKGLIIIGGILGVASIVIGGAYIYKKSTRKSLPHVSPIIATATPSSMPIALSTWTDPAGFSFQYPSDVTLTNHEEDEDSYAHVEFTKKDKPGGIVVLAKDIPAPNLSAWVKNEKSFLGATIIDTTLGGLPAKKILITSPVKKIIVGTISDGILFSLEGDFGDDEYWMKTQDGVVGSFAFAPDTTSETAAQPGKNASSDTSVDEEEVVQ